MLDKRARIEIVWSGEVGVIPEIKFFGQVQPYELNGLSFHLKRAYSMFCIEENRRIERNEKETAATNQKEQATKKEQEDESGTIGSTEAKSGRVETGSNGSGTSEGRGSGKTILSTNN